MDFFQAVEAWSLSAFLRGSIWAYPLVNTLHLLGVALLIGSTVAIDLRVLGVWQRVPPRAVVTVLVPVAMTGFALAVIAGPLLFLVQAKTYAALWLFQVKIGLVVLAVANAAWVARSSAWSDFRNGGQASTGLKLLTLISLVLWLAILVLGRLVGYA